ncbi:hypothetical protein, partial [Pseudomonas marginalis]|nr:hypothetical protein [Pseudomonas marginalis]
LGQDNDGKTLILKGLEEGQKVVTSGQFLLDSEASLKGVVASSLDVLPSRGRLRKRKIKHVKLAAAAVAA